MTTSTTDGSREMPPPFASGYAPVNGLELYYEIHATRSAGESGWLTRRISWGGGR